MLEERTGRTEIIKVPSHVDIEESERAAEMAEKGVMRDEKEQKKAEQAREQKRQRQEEEETA